ncbi:hypothetical protein ACHAWU_004478 [Discostella pseudostelligera]|uniref:Uncharacterized protein n=1 Tax=Discostella pseudostelligera TaxID=259834 RepID=A0ABD3M1S9_9STRA
MRARKSKRGLTDSGSDRPYYDRYHSGHAAFALNVPRTIGARCINRLVGNDNLFITTFYSPHPPNASGIEGMGMRGNSTALIT